MNNRKRSGKSMILMLVIFTLVSSALGVGIGIFLMGRSKGGAKHEGQTGEAKTKAKQHPAIVYSLGEMVVNLADQGSLRYAKITVAIGFAEKVDEAKLKTYEPLMKDAVIGVVTGRRFDELHRKGGIQLVKDDIRKAVMEQISDLKVGEVYLEAFAMQ